MTIRNQNVKIRKVWVFTQTDEIFHHKFFFFGFTDYANTFITKNAGRRVDTYAKMYVCSRKVTLNTPPLLIFNQKFGNDWFMSVTWGESNSYTWLSIHD